MKEIEYSQKSTVRWELSEGAHDVIKNAHKKATGSCSGKMVKRGKMHVYLIGVTRSYQKILV